MVDFFKNNRELDFVFVQLTRVVNYSGDWFFYADNIGRAIIFCFECKHLLLCCIGVVHAL